MRKLAAFLLAGIMAVSCVACGTKKEDSKKNEATVQITDATELLTNVWGAVPEDKAFYVVGGDTENMVDGNPGAFNLEKAEELGLENNMCYPLTAVDYIDGAATLIHGMISNGFTAGAYHLKDAANAKTVVDAIQERTLSNRWMCGMPEKLMIVTVGDYVVSAYGYTDNIDAFKSAMTSVYADAVEVVVEQAIEE